ncbi:MAG: hypothetical protein PHH93_00410 [Prolixibacteraceae bacterium]|nr:hypothetical protein [Prolixibacteraceae bacterium]
MAQSTTTSLHASHYLRRINHESGEARQMSDFQTFRPSTFRLSDFQTFDLQTFDLQTSRPPDLQTFRPSDFQTSDLNPFHF